MKNVLITGTSTGFGKATAEHLSSLGYNIIGTSRNPDKLNPNHDMLQLDVCKDESVKNAVEKAIEKMGRIDVLVNNAGFALSGPIEDTSIEEAKTQLDTNFFGAVRMTKAVLPYMRKNKKGLIINISSIGGLIGMPFQGFYSASKFAMEGYTEALRIEVKPFGIDVVNINPGDFKTSVIQNRKIVQNLGSVYKKRFHHILDIYQSDEQNGNDPHELAKLVERLIKKGDKYKVRYLIGKISQTAGIKIKNLVGSRMFEKMMVGTYK